MNAKHVRNKEYYEANRKKIIEKAKKSQKDQRFERLKSKGIPNIIIPYIRLNVKTVTLAFANAEALKNFIIELHDNYKDFIIEVDIYNSELKNTEYQIAQIHDKKAHNILKEQGIPHFLVPYFNSTDKSKLLTFLSLDELLCFCMILHQNYDTFIKELQIYISNYSKSKPAETP